MPQASERQLCLLMRPLVISVEGRLLSSRRRLPVNKTFYIV